MRKFCLKHNRAPGDILVMTSLVRDLALTHPNKYQVCVDTTCREIWENNPHIQNDGDNTNLETYELDYGPSLNKVSTRSNHFLYSFYDDFRKHTGIHVPLLYPRPDYHLSDYEKNTKIVDGRYWVILSGGKSDLTTKHWSYKRWQQVVNILRNYGLRFVQVGMNRKGDKLSHYHPPLENTLCLLNQTNLRQLGQLIYHADGVICPITVTMHMAAALQKPCVVIAGGREDWWWAGYIKNRGNFGKDLLEDVKVPHRYLTTVGKLDCCKTKACWTSQVAVDCKFPINMRGQLLPKCMDLITVEHVIHAVMSYYRDGTILPLTTPKSIYYKNDVPITDISAIPELTLAQ